MIRAAHGDAEMNLPSATEVEAVAATSEPRLLVIDDANLGGDEFQSAVARLARTVRSGPLLLAVVDRMEGHDGGIRRLRDLPEALTISPAPLSPDEVQKLSESYGHPEAAGDVSRLSGGNAFLASRLLSGWGRNEGLPESVRAWVARRFHNLDDEAGMVARVMATLGGAGTLADLEGIAGLSTAGTLSAIDRLQAAGFLESADPPLLGPPVLVQAVQDAIPAGESIRLSLAVAERLRRRDPQTAANHLIRARPEGPSPEKWAADVLRSAAETSSASGDTDRSIELLRRLIDEELVDSERLGALSMLGEMEAERRDPAAIGHLAEASTLAGDPLVRGRLALVRGRALFHLVALDDCSRVCRDAIDDLPQRERELRLALESTALDAEALLGVRRERPGELLDEVSMASTPGERMVLTHVLADQAASGSATAAEIRRSGRLILESGDLLGEVGANSPTYIYLGTALTWAGAYDEVIALTSDGIARGRAEGLPAAVSYSAALRSGCALLIGDLDLAEADSSLVVNELAAADPMSFAVALAWYLEVLVHRGRLDEARAVLDGSGLTGDLPELGTIDFLMLARGALAAAEGDTPKALSEFEEVGRRATRATYVNPAAMDWRSRAALAHLELGELPRALELARDELIRAEAFGTKRSRGVALIALGTVEGGSTGVRMLEQSVTLLGEVSPLERSRAQIALGELLHRRGDPRAREVLYGGLGAAQAAGSSLLADRAVGSLRETGAKPRRRALTGVDSLTRQERRAADLAAEGLTNPQIAERMFLTRRTVEMHLSNAYGKLEIKGRSELPGALQSSSP